MSSSLESDFSGAEKRTTPFTVEQRKGHGTFWSANSSALSTVLYDAFMADFNNQDLQNLYYHLEYECLSPKTTIFLLRHKDTHNIVGFTSYYPITEDNGHLYHVFEEKLNLPKILIQPHAAMVGNTAITPEYRHQGGWRMLMDALDQDVLRTESVYMVRTVRTNENYSNIVKQRYLPYILDKSSFWSLGQQERLWMDLSPLLV